MRGTQGRRGGLIALTVAATTLTTAAAPKTLRATQSATVMPVPVAEGSTKPVDWEALSAAYLRGDLDSVAVLLRHTLKSFICNLNCVDELTQTGLGAFDFKMHYYFVVFPVQVPRRGVEAVDTAHALARVLLHHPSPDPYENLLRGVDGTSSKLFELVLFPQRYQQLELAASDSTEAAWHSSVYSFENEKDPVLEQLPAFVKAYLPFSLIQHLLTNGARMPLLVGEVPIPFDRAKVTVSDEYRLAGTTKPLTAKDVYYSAPDTHVSFGVLSGLVLDSGGSGNFKVDGELIAADPTSRLLAMGVVNWHPIGFQPRSRSMTFGERFRLFLGLVATPKVGFAAGLGFGLMRGLSLNVGAGFLAVDSLRDGDFASHPPSEPADPFDLGTRRVAFAGVGFKLP